MVLAAEENYVDMLEPDVVVILSVFLSSEESYLLNSSHKKGVSHEKNRIPF